MKVAKTALIAGATSRIGKAFAEELAGRGYGLLITGRRAKEIRREIRVRLEFDFLFYRGYTRECHVSRADSGAECPYAKGEY